MGTLFPEQLQALEYSRTQGTEATLESIRTSVVSTFAEFEKLVGGIPEHVAREHRKSSAWSIQEVVDHLVVTDRPAVTQLAQLLAGKSIEDAIPAGLQSEHPLDLSWDGLRKEFKAVHGDIVDLLEGADDAIPLEATAPIQMVVKCRHPDGGLRPVQWIERFDWKAYSILLHAHNQEHIAQVQRILNAPSE